jgi:hypothetical protein
MPLKKLNKISISEILIIVLLIVILLQRCGRNPENPTGPQITRDTVWVHTDSTITKQPQCIKTITVPIEQWNTEYLPDTSSMAILIKQYTELANKFLAINIHQDSIRIDTIGTVRITDTVTNNLIKSRKTTYSFKIPIITNMITIPEKKRNQFYIGGYIQGNQNSFNEIGANLLFKDKKDKMFGFSAGINTDGQIMYGVSSFWKIKINGKSN